LRFLPGDIFLNAFASAFAEVTGPVIGSFWYKMTGLNISLIITLTLSTAGSVLIIDYGDLIPRYMPLWCLFARSGVAAAYNIVYNGH